MKIDEFFNSKELELPRSWKGDSRNFEVFLKDVFEKYKEKCDSFLSPDESRHNNFSGETRDFIVGGMEKFEEVSMPYLTNAIRARLEQEEFLQKCKSITDKILEIIEKYFNGHSGKAYDEFKNLLDSSDCNICGLISCPVDKDHVYFPFSNLYRLRSTDEDLSDNPLGLFHVPYSLRERIGTERYSIPGFPCLYLGGSIGLCWHECNQPSLKNLWGDSL